MYIISSKAIVASEGQESFYYGTHNTYYWTNIESTSAQNKD